MKRSILLSLILFLGFLPIGCVANTRVSPGPKLDNLEENTFIEECIEDEEHLTEDEEQVDNNLDDSNIDDPEEVKALLTDSLNRVDNIKVLYPVRAHDILNPRGYYYVEASYEIPNDINVIKKIYNSIESTKTEYNKVTPAGEGQQSDPTFIIQIYYSNGRIDTVNSTETGEGIYRNTSSVNPSWIGGRNTELQHILGDGAWLYKKEYSEASEKVYKLLSSLRDNLKANNLESAKLLTEGVKDEYLKDLNGGNFEVYGSLVYHQDGTISIITIDRRGERIKHLAFTFIKDKQQNWKINNIEFDVDFY